MNAVGYPSAVFPARSRATAQARGMPLRYPALLLVFLALTLENPSDAPACGAWRSRRITRTGSPYS